MRGRLPEVLIVLASVLLAPASANAQSASLKVLKVMPPADVSGAIDVLFPTGSRVAKISASTLSSGFLVYPDATGFDAPMAGTYQALSDRLRFTPLFPLRRGVTYVISLDENCLLNGDGSCSAEAGPHSTFMIETEEEGVRARVTQIEPTGEMLPANLLRFYLHFSEPMSEGDIYKHILLAREDGTLVPSPFLNLNVHLWNDDQTRLTVLFDPGRIKRGVGPNEEAGAPLVEGQTYKLIVSPGLRDAKGRLLLERAEKQFRVTAPVRERLDPLAWNLSSPSAGSYQALEVDTSVGIDGGDLGQSVSVVDAMGERVLGSLRLATGRQGFEFVPVTTWTAGNYRMVVRTDLEDISGNSIRSVLDSIEGRKNSIDQKTVSIGFSVSSF